LDGGMCLVPQPVPPAPSTSADGGVSHAPASADLMRALGYLAEDPPAASFEKELPKSGLGLGLKGGPNGIGRNVPGLGDTTIVPGKQAPELTDELVRRDPVPDGPTISKRPADEPRAGGRTTYRVELPDGGVTRR
ncbi:MAG: hypothetical protein ACKV2T_07920, partial [Kofleriaceae bacterium]